MTSESKSGSKTTIAIIGNKVEAISKRNHRVVRERCATSVGVFIPPSSIAAGITSRRVSKLACEFTARVERLDEVEEWHKARPVEHIVFFAFRIIKRIGRDVTKSPC